MTQILCFCLLHGLQLIHTHTLVLLVSDDLDYIAAKGQLKMSPRKLNMVTRPSLQQPIWSLNPRKIKLHFGKT